MDLRDYATLLRKRWKLIVACALIGLIAAGTFVSLATKSYSASIKLFVSTTDGGSNISSVQAGGLFSQQRVVSYADIVGTPPVTQPVIKQLGLNLTASALAGKISASAPLNTVLINISVTDPSAVQAQAIANAVGAQFVTVVNALETPAGSARSPVKVSVVQQASLPGAPVSPKKKLDLVLGLLVGLAVGVGTAVLRQTFDTTLHSPQEMQAIAPGLATLGIIGFDPEATKNPLIVEVSPHSPRAEAFRQLRTNLRFVDPDHPLRTVVITSAVPREGKSTTAANLAITLARAGVSVLLVEADLRRPRLGKYLNVPEDAAGLSDVLIGHATLDAAVRKHGTDGPFILSAGSKPPNPSELLGSDAMQDLLREVSARFDFVLIDAPPLLPVTDAAVLGQITDGVLFVTHAGRTKREQVARAIASLDSVNAHKLGVVFNQVGGSGSSGFGYGYGYYGYYGYYGEGDAKPHWWRRSRPVLDQNATSVAESAKLPERVEQADKPHEHAPASNGARDELPGDRILQRLRGISRTPSRRVGLTAPADAGPADVAFAAETTPGLDQ